MKYIISLMIMSISLIAQDYYAKIQAINEYNIKSAISGKVTLSNTSLESTFVKDAIIIKVDDKINKIELQQTLNKITNQRQILTIQKQTLNSFNKVSSKSKFDKDRQKIVILSTKVVLNDLKTKLYTLKDIIKNKNIRVNNLYINKIYVNKEDFVNPGTLLLSAYDLSKGKLIIFVNKNDIKNIKEKSILIDDKNVDVIISKVYKTTDEKHLSSYKVELILPKVDTFSKLVKVSIK